MTWIGLFLAMAAAQFGQTNDDFIDGGVVHIQMPNEDVELSYVESKGGMSLELRARSVSIGGRKFFVGDGKIAVPLVAHPLEGILFQGATMLKHGHEFKRGDRVKVLPGFKRAADLRPGDVYITMPGIVFDTRQS